MAHHQVPLFHHPIRNELNKQLIYDLEMPMIYTQLCEAKTPIRQEIAKEMCQYTTTDKKYLQNMRKILRQLAAQQTWCDEESGGFHAIWKCVQAETSFEKKYLYLEFWHHWNLHAGFLQIMSVYHVLSPIMSLLFPILLLILPFFLLLAQGVSLTLTQYTAVLMEIAQNHAIGRIFQAGSSDSIQEKAMLGVSVGFYLFSIYQNIRICHQFYLNYQQICSYLASCREYCRRTLDKINLVSPFLLRLPRGYRQEITRLHQQLTLYFTRILDAENSDLSCGIGKRMACFYEWRAQENSCSFPMEASFAFHAFWDNLHAFSLQPFGEANFPKTAATAIRFRGAWYPVIPVGEQVKNNVSKMQHLIVTGPNASGKTTLLKTLFLNTILTQQFGRGAYQSAQFPHLFTHFYAYINIPDTSGRDSLFQAEARRCKSILDTIQTRPKQEWHLCMLDELYSGTNPEEATQSAQSFMAYLIQQPNVVSLLTTHFTKICSQLPGAQIKQMHCERDTGTQKIKYTYLMRPGISTIQGAKDILKEMQYPEEILSRIGCP